MLRPELVTFSSGCVNAFPHLGEKKSQRPHVLSFFSATTRLSLYEASDPNSEGNEDNVDVTFFELSTVVAATDNFSSINKLGQGGFGQVYKVINFTSQKNILTFFIYFKYIISGMKVIVLQFFNNYFRPSAEFCQEET